MKEYKLTDVCDFQGGTQPPKNEWINLPREGYVRMLQIRDFTQGKVEHIEYVKDNKKVNKCKSDDILIARYGASIGKIVTGLEGAYNVALIKTIPNEKLLTKKYLQAVLNSPVFQNFILGIGARAAQAGFNKEDLSRFKIHLPSLNDQIRIAEILSRAESLIAQRKQSISLLDELLKSTFLEMFGDPIKNPKQLEKKQLQDVCIKITDGTHFSPPIIEKGFPYITAKHVRENKIDFWAKPWFISEENHREIYKRCTPVKGDVLYIKDGATTGYAAINRYDFEFSMLSSLALLKVDSKILNSEYLCAWLNNEIVKKRILEEMSGGAIQRLTLTKINKLSINIPPIELQTKFRAIVEKVEELKSKNQESLAELQNMYGVLSQKAFRGELKGSDKLQMLDVEYARDSDRMVAEEGVKYKKIASYKKSK